MATAQLSLNKDTLTGLLGLRFYCLGFLVNISERWWLSQWTRKADEDEEEEEDTIFPSTTCSTTVTTRFVKVEEDEEDEEDMELSDQSENTSVWLTFLCVIPLNSSLDCWSHKTRYLKMLYFLLYFLSSCLLITHYVLLN